MRNLFHFSLIVIRFLLMLIHILHCTSIKKRIPVVSSTTISESSRPISNHAASTINSENSKALDTSSIILKTSLSELKGVGSATCSQLEQLKLRTVNDVLFHLPTGYIDRTKRRSLSEAVEGKHITMELTCENVKLGYGKMPHRIFCRDRENNRVTIQHFCGGNNYAASAFKTLKNRLYKPGNRIVTSGKYFEDSIGDKFVIVNPDLVLQHSNDNLEQIDQELNKESQTIYPLTQGLTVKKMNTIVSAALDLVLKDIKCNNSPLSWLDSEWIDKYFLSKKNWPSFPEALCKIHSPRQIDDLDVVKNPARLRLAFEELVIKQLMAYHKAQDRKQKYDIICSRQQTDYSIKNSDKYCNKLLELLPFNLTSCQLRAIGDIQKDLTSPKRMIRLVQGDVGSGKTIVAIMAILKAIESGRQVALLAPTELLAKQHWKSINGYLNMLNEALTSSDATATNLQASFLTSNVKGKARKKLFDDMKQNIVQVIVGTHALLSREVIDSFSSLSLVVIDEEQRFGVNQRSMLSEITNVLYTTATPIPRSLALSNQEDFYISNLVTKLPVKREVKTLLYFYDMLDTVIGIIKDNIPYGTKIFWVTPALNANTQFMGSSALERFEMLEDIFPGKVGLLHGKMSSVDKDNILERFAMKPSETKSFNQSTDSQQSRISILVSTTVIEVGIDVPDASICIIERASYFGLAQIHQIRGRIGRGDPPKSERLKFPLCILLTKRNAFDSDNEYFHKHRTELLDVDSEVPSAEVPACFDIRGEYVLPESQDDIKERNPTDAQLRLQTLVETNDCFEISERDLQIRGPGDLFGHRQHGQINYRVASMPEHIPLLLEAHKAALQIRDGVYSEAQICPEHPNIKIMKEIYADENDRVDTALEDFDNELTKTPKENSRIEDESYADTKSAPITLTVLPTTMFHTIPSHMSVPGHVECRSCMDISFSQNGILRSGVNRFGAEHLANFEPVASTLEDDKSFEDITMSDNYTDYDLESLDLTLNQQLHSYPQSQSYKESTSSIQTFKYVARPRAETFSSPITKTFIAATPVINAATSPPSNQQHLSVTKLAGTFVAQQIKTVKHTKIRIDDPNTVIVIFDVESTGLSTKNDRVIQLAAKVLDREAAIYNVYIKPDLKLDSKIESLTGITNDFLDSSGVTFKEAWEGFQQWVADETKWHQYENDSTDEFMSLHRPVVFIGHNSKRYDCRILEAELMRLASIESRSYVNKSWFYNLPTSSRIEYCFMDSLQAFEDCSLWAPAVEVVGREIHTKNITHQEMIIEEPNEFNFWRTVTVQVAIEPNRTPTKYSEPKNKGMKHLYPYFFGAQQQNGHNALDDVLCLEELLLHPKAYEGWKSVGNNMLFDITTVNTSSPTNVE